MKEKVKILVMLLAALVMVSTATGEIIFVDVDATGVNDGLNWADAFNSLQDALAVAQFGDEIRAAQGIYKPDEGIGITPGDREATFQLINGVTLKGSYAGAGEVDPDARDIELYETILSGDLAGNDRPDFANNAENSYHVVTGSGTDDTAILDGFTITAGNANGYYPENDGGGMYNNESNPKLMNCTFTENSAERGGGVYNHRSNPTLTNCTFTENSAERGGGMYNNSSSSVTLTSCIFSGNVAQIYGGGMYNDQSYPTVTNCTFAGNLAHEQGGGINISCGKPILINCILWDNIAPTGSQISGNGTVLYSNVEGGWPGEGNIDADPYFVQPGYWDINIPPSPPPPPPPPPPLPPPPPCCPPTLAASYTSYNPYYIWVEGDYHLLPDSPCIDAGDPDYVAGPNEMDLDGKPRVLDGNGDAVPVVDMGAYESLPLTPYEIAVIKVEKAIFEKMETLEQIDATLEQEWTAYQALEELLESGDYGDLKKSDITKAMQQIHSSIQHEELSKKAIQRSIEKLLYSLSTLGYGPQPPGSNWPPYVTITKPQDGARLSPSQTIEIEADALDFDGSVVMVEFFANGNKIAEDTDGTDGWTTNWSDHPEGSYSLTATATDDEGAATTSSAVEIIVVVLPPPPSPPPPPGPP